MIGEVWQCENLRCLWVGECVLGYGHTGVVDADGGRFSRCTVVQNWTRVEPAPADGQVWVRGDQRVSLRRGAGEVFMVIDALGELVWNHTNAMRLAREFFRYRWHCCSTAFVANLRVPKFEFTFDGLAPLTSSIDGVVKHLTAVGERLTRPMTREEIGAALDDVRGRPFATAIRAVVMARAETHKVRPFEVVDLLTAVDAWERERSRVAPGMRALRREHFDACLRAATKHTSHIFAEDMALYEKWRHL